jgi:hypothetical protein
MHGLQLLNSFRVACRNDLAALEQRPCSADWPRSSSASKANITDARPRGPNQMRARAVASRICRSVRPHLRG